MVTDSVTLLLIDPHQLFMDGLISLLERKQSFEIVGAFTNPSSGLHAYKKLQPQITIISDCFPDMHTVTLIQEIKLFRKQAKVIVLAGKLQDFMVLESIKSGVDGFIARSSGFHILEKALEKIINSESYYCDMVSQILAKSLLSRTENTTGNNYLLSILTNREKEVMIALLEGMSISSIAVSLNISRKTVATHKSKIFKKFNITSLIDLVRIGNELGFTP